MDVEILTIGTELLLGHVIDENAAFLGRALGSLGVRVTRRTTVADQAGAIEAAVGEGLARTRFVVTSGGLGPTSDDVTKRAVAGIYGAELEFVPAIWETLVARFARQGRQPPERNRCQAEVPRGAEVLPNPRGTAPGLWLSGPCGEVVMLPGVPAEFRGLVGEALLPRLRDRGMGRGGVIRSLTLRTTGLAESAVADRLADLEPELAPLTLAFLPGLDGVDLRLTSWEGAEPLATRDLARAGERLAERLAGHVYGRDEDDLAGMLVREFRARGWRLAVAESCTGGMLGQRITAIPGSSAVFLGGVIAYADRLKEELGVPARILAARGAVSEETAGQMALAVRDRYRADIGLAITGIAGPDGGLPEKPVGLVWSALASGAGVEAFRTIFPGSRQEIRARACQQALWKAWSLARTAP